MFPNNLSGNSLFCSMLTGLKSWLRFPTALLTVVWVLCLIPGTARTQTPGSRPAFLTVRPGDPPDSIFRSQYVGKTARYFQEWKSQEENQRYQQFRYRKVRYLAYKNQIHSVIIRMDFTDSNKEFLTLLTREFGEGKRTDLYRTILYWDTPEYFVSYEEDIIGDLIEVRVVSQTVQQLFETENPEALE